MYTDLVSIIIPVYNVEDWIQKSLLSALNQSYSNIEYIIVDDCGTDNSMDIVRFVIQAYEEKKIKIVKHATNRGLSEARNTGLKASNGLYVFFMDSDDEIPNNCIELHMSAIKRYSADFTDGNVQLSTLKKYFKEYTNEYIIEGKTNLLNSYYSGMLHVCAWNKLIKRDILIKNDIYFTPQIYYEDSIWLLDLLDNSSKCACVNHKTYLYNIRENSITTTGNLDKISKQYDSWNHILNNICERIETYDNMKLSNLSKKWMGKLRFKILFRLISINAFNKNKNKWARMVSTQIMKTNSIGFWSYLSNLPFGLFKIIFYLPQKILIK